MSATTETPRSPHWPHVRAQVLTARGNRCELSQRTTSLEVHHKIPFHFGVLLNRGYIELDPRNLIIVSCHPDNLHLLLAHLDSWESYNPNVDWYRQRPPWTTSLIEAEPVWQAAKAARPKTWEQMTAADKTTLTNVIDQLYPIK